MKRIYPWSVVAVVAMGIAAAAVAQSNAPLPARVVLADALKTAKAENKNVLIRFGASWCKWCKRFDAMLESKEVGKLFQDNFVVAQLAIQERRGSVALENPGAAELAASAGAGGVAVPVYIFFDGTGTRLATSLAMPNRSNIGHPGTPEEIQAFAALLEKTAPRMSAAERKRIVDYLSAQKY